MSHLCFAVSCCNRMGGRVVVVWCFCLFAGGLCLVGFVWLVLCVVCCCFTVFPIRCCLRTKDVKPSLCLREWTLDGDLTPFPGFWYPSWSFRPSWYLLSPSYLPYGTPPLARPFFVLAITILDSHSFPTLFHSFRLSPSYTHFPCLPSATFALGFCSPISCALHSDSLLSHPPSLRAARLPWGSKVICAVS